MKSFYSGLKIVLFLGLLIAELVILNWFSKETILLISYGILVLNFLLVLYFFIRKQTEKISAFLIKVINNIASNFIGILSIIYFIFNISWLTDSLIMSNNSSTLHYSSSLLYLAFLLFPYLFLSLFSKKRDMEPDNQERKILFSSLSLLDPFKSNKESLSDNEIKKLEKMYNYDFSKWTVSDRIQWQPIFKAIDKLGNIKEVVLFHTKETELLNNMILNSKYKSCDIVSLLQKYFPQIKKICFQKIEDPNDIQLTIDEINYIVRKKSRTYDDDQMVFSITGGTAVISAAMAIISMKGLRGIVYSHQQSLEIISTPVNVFNIKELWTEIANQYE